MSWEDRKRPDPEYLLMRRSSNYHPEPFNLRQPRHRLAVEVVKRIEHRNGGKITFGQETYRDIEMLISQLLDDAHGEPE